MQAVSSEDVSEVIKVSLFEVERFVLATCNISRVFLSGS